MGRLISTAGSQIFIGSVAKFNDGPDFVLADFSGVTWIEIGGHTDLGQLGDTATKVTSEQIRINRVRKAKGTRDGGSQQLVCDIDYTDPGQLALIAAERSQDSFPFKMVLPKRTPRSSTVTMTIASPGVVTWAAHGLAANDPIRFSTSGALPTGLVAGTTYYVKTVLDANTFTVSATAGGTVIATTGTQSGVHTIETLPSGPERYYTAFVNSAPENYGSANNPMKLNVMLDVDSNIVRN